jgi:hypothetical protein
MLRPEVVDEIKVVLDERLKGLPWPSDEKIDRQYVLQTRIVEAMMERRD